MPDFEPSPFAEFAPDPPPAPVFAPLRYELRPMSLGEILDRTFAVYRQNFWLYAGMSSLSALVPVLSTLAQYFFVLPVAGRVGQTSAQLARVGFVTGGILIGAIVLAIVIYGVTQAATAVAFANDYLGEYLGRPASIKASFDLARKHWFRYILILLWQSLSAAWLTGLLFGVAIGLIAVPSLRIVGGLLVFPALASLVYAVIAYIRNSLGVIASVLEDLPVVKAMKRSKFLVAGHKGRVFGILLTAWVLQVVASVFQGVTGFFVGISHGPVRLLCEAVTLLVTFCTSSVVLPVLSIALCLLYIDERVRKEGFDVEILMLRGGAPPPPPIDALASPFTSELV